MKIDAHQHYWQVERGDYGWLTPDQDVLYRDFMPLQLRPLLSRHQIKRTVVIQAAPTMEETSFLLRLCEEEDTLAGVVGWIDLESDQFSSEFARLCSNPYFIGLRPMLQDLGDTSYILRPQVLRSLERVAAASIPLDLLIQPRHLHSIIVMLERIPNLHTVVNHIAKPCIAKGELEPWRSDLARLANHSNVYCKLSGMVTEAVHGRWNIEDFVPFVSHVLDIFGSSRVMFGSDWPVCLLSADYSEVIHLLERLLPEQWGELEHKLVFGGNAARFYRLER